MDTYFAKRDADYLPVPPLLISTSGLEGYLEQLSRRLGRDIVDVKHQVEVSSRDVADACVTVNRVKRFLATKAMTQMEGQLSETFTNDDAMEEVEKDFERALGGYENVEQPDVFSGMLVIAKKLVKENTALKQALTDNAKVITAFNEQQARMSAEMETVNQRLQTQQRDFHQLSLWLGTYDKTRETTTALATPLPSQHATPTNGTFEALPLQLPTESEVDTYIAHSPLFLSLRRLLLRDVSERITSSSEVQSREVGDLVAQLKKEVTRQSTNERTGTAVEERRANESQGVIDGLNKRLKEVESNYVRREQLTSSLKTKADTLLLPVKADTAEVSTLERKVFDKYADLEERVAYFEAEREEFRKTLHTILALMPQQASGEPMDAASVAAVSGRQGSARARAAGRAPEPTTLRDVLDSAPRQPATAADDGCDPRLAATHSGLPLSGRAGDSKPIYRVIGANRSGFATSARGGGDGAGGGAAPASKKDTGRHPSPTPPTKTKAATHPSLGAGNEGSSSSAQGPAVEAIGMTANQAAYAQYVTREMNRGQVESLPPLPYERLLNPQP